MATKTTKKPDINEQLEQFGLCIEVLPVDAVKPQVVQELLEKSKSQAAVAERYPVSSSDHWRHRLNAESIRAHALTLVVEMGTGRRHLGQ